jgi:hypothetical protein
MALVPLIVSEGVITILSTVGIVLAPTLIHGSGGRAKRALTDDELGKCSVRRHRESLSYHYGGEEYRVEMEYYLHEQEFSGEVPITFGSLLTLE